MSASFYDLLKFAKTGIASPSMTNYDKLKALSMCKAGFPVKTLTGVPPIPFDSDGTPLIAWTVVGNEQQTGTPTPSNQIYPTECGEKNANLYNSAETSWTSGVKDDNGNTTGSTASHFTSNFTAVKASTKYSITGIYASGSSTAARIYYYDSSKAWISRTAAMRDNPLVFETPANCAYIQVQCANGVDGSNFMLVEGEYTSQTMPSFEPYGYKIPITLAGQTQTIYLDEPLRKIGDYADTVEQDGTVTRRIKKLVLTGEETTWGSPNTVVFRLTVNGYIRDDAFSPYCTHYEGQTTISSLQAVSEGHIAFLVSSSGNNYMYIRDSSAGNLDDFKAYLAAQYDASTAVTIWYVLANPVTETVTVPTLTPTKGSNTLSIGTTLQPSSVSITGGIK